MADMIPWEVRMSRSRQQPYFFNKDSQESSWTNPPGLSLDEIKTLPGADLLNLDGKKVEQVRASHLLVKHRGSRRPSSWKEETITRSKEEAIELLRQYEAQIDNSPDKFGELASKHSDCSSHSNRGDLGWFQRGMMQKPFEEAAYGLEIGQMSSVVETDSGVHLILRTA
ncbi:rotamase-domain-containing protein [Fomitiporia mediterranea MF3/22]|uniref:rotamase-domain-containing protein n=1 Tax=Fomitiporia mediterranea (strain MF3/22) TaxID=694068 RepID=UPI0004407CA6|nr:rotamase-domain-containing protein [Fomitiporia mediterranea MF3/22]EJC98823.1 rotamase-domain-containing protein [Fomitiporia mediterranea MF3/22]